MLSFKVDGSKQLVNSRARRVAKSISFKRFVREEIKLTRRLYKGAESFIAKRYQFKITYTKKGKNYYKVSFAREEQMNKSWREAASLQKERSSHPPLRCLATPWRGLEQGTGRQIAPGRR